MIRSATHEDIPALVGMGKQFHAASIDKDIPYDPDGAVSFFKALIGSDMGFVAISETGFVAGLTTTLPQLQKDYLIASECYWWAERDGNDLIKAFERWAKERGASRIVISHRHDTRNAALSRLYRMMGYEPYEHYYMRAI